MDNFQAECLLGEGGFGRVYRGRLESGQMVAVKQLDREGPQGNREFVVEVMMLSLLHHPNLMNLVGATAPTASSGCSCTSTWCWGRWRTTCCSCPAATSGTL